MTETLEARLERAVVEIIRLGRSRCSAGFGKYPLGIMDAVRELLPIVEGSQAVQEELRLFEKRLET